jgi:nucleoside 2-deoxyribosyltransferase
MKVYLASPFFNDKEKTEKEKVRQRLISLGYEVIDPQNSDHINSWELNNNDWANNVFIKDGKFITEADAVVAIDWGLYGDCGTACEVGIASVLEKPILIIAPDKTLSQPHSLMVVQSGVNFISMSRFLEVERKWFSDNTKPFFLYGVEQK